MQNAVIATFQVLVTDLLCNEGLVLGVWEAFDGSHCFGYHFLHLFFTHIGIFGKTRNKWTEINVEQ